MIKPISFFISILTLIACTDNRDTENETICQIALFKSVTTTTTHEIANNYDSVFYSDNGKLERIIHTDLSYGDTSIVHYLLEYNESGAISKVYWKNPALKDEKPLSERIFLEIKYNADRISSIKYFNGLIGDIEYEGELLKSYKYFHHYDLNIDSSRTRKIEFEYDKLGNICKQKDYRISDNRIYTYAELSYDTLINPLYKNALCLILEYNLASYLSKHNWVEVLALDDSNKFNGSNDIIYNADGFPISVHTKYEHEINIYDTIYYTCNE